MTNEKNKTIVLALGGNALIKQGQKGTIYEEFANTREILDSFITLLKEDYNFVITHGNGPQVGYRLLRVEKTIDIIPETPLGVLVADSQGGMGYMIEQSLQNRLLINKIDRKVVTVLTQVIVDKDDLHLKNPTKPVGRFYMKEEAEQLQKTHNWIIKEMGKKGYRRVVPSPTPLEIVEKDIIKLLLEKKVIVIAAGGGGIPVYIEKDGTFEGIDAVVDKDLATSILAKDIHADVLAIMTDIDRVYLNYNSNNPTPLDRLSIEEAKRYYDQGHFPDGSMGPKIQAAINFIQSGGAKVIITSGSCLKEALCGNGGTTIVP